MTNSCVYLISRGCVYEHLKSDFSADTIDRQFSLRNKKISKHLKQKTYHSLEKMTSKPSSKNTKVEKLKYTKRFAAGKIIGLQNIIPEFA